MRVWWRTLTDRARPCSRLVKACCHRPTRVGVRTVTLFHPRLQLDSRVRVWPLRIQVSCASAGGDASWAREVGLFGKPAGFRLRCFRSGLRVSADIGTTPSRPHPEGDVRVAARYRWFGCFERLGLFGTGGVSSSAASGSGTAPSRSRLGMGVASHRRGGLFWCRKYRSLGFLGNVDRRKRLSHMGTRMAKAKPDR